MAGHPARCPHRQLLCPLPFFSPLPLSHSLPLPTLAQKSVSGPQPLPTLCLELPGNLISSTDSDKGPTAEGMASRREERARSSPKLPKPSWVRLPGILPATCPRWPYGHVPAHRAVWIPHERGHKAWTASAHLSLAKSPAPRRICKSRARAQDTSSFQPCHSLAKSAGSSVIGDLCFLEGRSVASQHPRVDTTGD